MISRHSPTRLTRIAQVLAVVAVVIGVGARVYAFDTTPPGLNQDEASSGYEAWNLLQHGVDRNLISWPVHIVSWGSGQNALYVYAAMPFMAFGLTPVTTRLPMLISGLLSLPLAWWIARRLFGDLAGLGALMLVALSPWHIMLSRMALDDNLLPFVFMGALACFLQACYPPRNAEPSERRRLAWLIAACALFGLCPYSYGTAYVIVPLFLFGAFAIALASRAVTWRNALIGLAAFALVALPSALYLAVNVFKWDTIVIAGMSIPRLPSTPRFQGQLSEGPLKNLDKMAELLITQRDGTLYNVTDPYGVMYSVIFLALGFGLAGCALYFAITRRWPAQRALMAVWILACIPAGILQEPNVNRVNLLWMGLLVCAGIALAVLDARLRGVFVAGGLALVLMSGFFVRDYFTTQRDRLKPEFFAGLLPALAQAQAATAGNICVTGNVNMPYIYALFAERGDPRDFARTVQYLDPTNQFRQVTSYGRYAFGLDRCDFATAQAVITRNDEQAPPPFEKAASFESFHLYLRR